MIGTNQGFSVDIGTGFDDDIDAGSMAILSGLHKGGPAILHNYDMIQGGDVVLSHIRFIAVSCRLAYGKRMHMRDRPYARRP